MITPTMQHDWDVVIIGAGVAGAAAATAIARGAPSARIALIERSAWPRDKVCGCCMNPAGVALIRDFGLTKTLASRSTPLDRVEIITPHQRAVLRHPGGAVIDRAALDAMLVDAATDEGVRFTPACAARVIRRENGMWIVRLRTAGTETEIRARVVIAADGLAGGAVADLEDSRFTPIVHPRSRMGVGMILPTWNPDPGSARMHLGSHGYVGVVDLPGGRTCIAAALDPTWMRETGGPAHAISAILAQCNVEAPELHGVPVRGAPTLTRARRCIAHRGLFVVGDAAGYVEPLSGEGMTWALAGARALGTIIADALADPTDAALDSASAHWHRFHARGLRPRQRWSRAVRAAARNPILTKWAIGALASGTIARLAAESVLARSSRSYAPMRGGAQ
jgi:flavin-dependent dehydrogenase